MDKLAVFDLDGTLLDTIDDIANACNYALNKQGFPVHPVNPYKYFVGSGVINLIERALPEGSRDMETTLLVKQDFDDYYTAHSADKTSPYPGIRAALKKIKAAGIRMAVLSNKPHAPTCRLVETYFQGVFDIVLGHREGVPHKPDPTAVYEIIKLLEAENARIFYIGDTFIDMETGKNAGATAVGVLWGFRTRAELENSGADVIISKPFELPGIIINCGRNR